MKRVVILLALSAVLVLFSCAVPVGSAPKLNVNPYLTPKARETVNAIIFEVQKVLDTLHTLRETNALPFVEKLDYPGWKIRKKSGHVFFLNTSSVEVEKVFDLPPDCVRSVDGAEMNVCHVKLLQVLPKLGEAFDCEVKLYQIRYPLREKVVISCN